MLVSTNHASFHTCHLQNARPLPIRDCDTGGTLHTRNGRHARFLAGARKDVPTQPDPFAESSRNPLAAPPPLGAPEPAATALNLRQQDFGLQLNLRPVILSSGLIRVRVNPQVRSVDFGNATSRRGRYVPALSTRQINVTYDVKPGQTIALTGLFDDETMQKLRRTGAAEEGLLKQMLDTADAKPNTDLVLLITPRSSSRPPSSNAKRSTQRPKLPAVRERAPTMV